VEVRSRGDVVGRCRRIVLPTWSVLGAAVLSRAGRGSRNVPTGMLPAGLARRLDGRDGLLRNSGKTASCGGPPRRIGVAIYLRGEHYQPA